MMMLANVLMIYIPSLPLWSGIVIAFAARNGASYFTKWYPQYRVRLAVPGVADHGHTRRGSARENDNEGRFRQARPGLSVDHRIPCAVSHHRRRGGGDRVAIAGAVAQVIYARVKGQQLGFMTYASLALVIVLGTTTLLTHDPRFVLAKPAIAHFAIGAIMLKRGWMLRYMPPIVTATHSGICHRRRLRLGGADVRARPRHHRDSHDRRYQAVGVLCVGGGIRRKDRGLCRPICRVSHAGKSGGCELQVPPLRRRDPLGLR